MRACSTDTSDEANDFVNASNSDASGRGFFFGGISPLLTRSCTSTHLEKFVEFAGSNFSVVRSNSPFFVSVSWHSTQFFSTNWRTTTGTSPAITGPVTARNRLDRANTLMPLKRLVFTRLFIIQIPAPREVNATVAVSKTIIHPVVVDSGRESQMHVIFP